MTPAEYARRAARQIVASLRRPAFAPDGHYYSPVPGVNDVERAVRGAADQSLLDVDLDERSQHALFRELADLAPRLPSSQTSGWRYFADNRMFGGADAAIYAAMLIREPPVRIVEIGSGFSSALALDIADRHGLNFGLTCVEPFPQRLLSLLCESDEGRIALHRVGVQDSELATFDELEAGDVLFIDSTHIAKAGSDVNFLIFNVLPRLSAGVRVHLHDAFWPFEYPPSWLRRGLAFSELYLLRAFLAFNTHWQVQLFNSWLWHKDPEARAWFNTRSAGSPDDSGPGSIWLRNH